MPKKIIKDGIIYEVYSDHINVFGFTDDISSNVVIPVKIENKPVTAIAKNAFKNCASLTSIKMSDNIEFIDDRAFWYCYNLKKMYLPKIINMVADFLFCCDTTPEIFFKGNKEDFEDMFYYDIFEAGIAKSKDGHRIHTTVHCTDGDLIC